MARNWDKFCLLLWKNWLLQWRHKYQTLGDILTPVFFCLLLVLLRSVVKPEDKKATTYNEFSALPIQLPNFTNPECTADEWTVAWSPQNNLIEHLMNASFCKIGDNCKFIEESIELLSFQNSQNLTSYLMNPLENHMDCTLVGIDFGDSLIDQYNLPEFISFSIRFPAESRIVSGSRRTMSSWNTDRLFPIFQVEGPRDPSSADGGTTPGYVPEGFLGIQNAISQVIIEHHVKVSNPSADIPEITLNRYPYPSYLHDPMLLALQALTPIVIMLCFSNICVSTVKAITIEKELQLKETMKIMGLSNWLHWTAWFIKTLSYATVSVIIIVILLKVKWYSNSDLAVFTHADGTVLFVFLLLFMFPTICFSFLLSVFFAKANVAAAIAGIAWFISFAPFLFMQYDYEHLSLTQKLVNCLGSNSAMAYGMQLMMMHESTGIGIQWGNIWSSVTPDDDFYLGHVMLMLSMDSLIYLIITLYIEKVYPGQYGVPLPWYFPFTTSYWCGASHDDISLVRSVHDDMVEPELEGLHAGIRIKQLRKVYYDKKVAVEGLNLNMYEDQITALLGHNGAGKTTTMSMLAGMFPPTGGTALVNGHDIRIDIDGVRDSLGICPQHNILFPDLTVREHLYFFAKLKGLPRSKIAQEIDHYIDLLELRPKADSASSTLSGGMQRKLSVGVALCGGSKVVLFDEPTSGMDPAARRALWDLLQSQKKGRTIVLTTHFMDEADLLGDRIAIMSGGKLKCAGTSFFLKKKFGAGYQLVIVKDVGCDVRKVTELLRKYVPEIYVETDVGTELSYSLDDRQSSVFEHMLRDLENNSNDLRLLSYGVSLTTLEEVFMKVGEENNGETVTEDRLNVTDERASCYQEIALAEPEANQKKLLTGLKLSCNQFEAMIIKKFIISQRNWLLFVIQNFILVFCIINTISSAPHMIGAGDLPALEMNLDFYDESFTTIQNNIYNNSINSPLLNQIIVQYETLISKKIHHTYKITNDPDMNAYILDMVKGKLNTYNTQYLVGASFEDSKITAWFNNQPYHALPLSLNLVHNAIIKGILGPRYSIEVVNAPLNFTQSIKFDKLSAGNTMGFQIAFNTGFAMAFVSAFYILFCVRERVCKAKHLQFVSGVEVLTFWATNFLWDMITYSITAFLWIVTIAPFHQDGFSTGLELSRALLVLLCFGWAMLPMIYLASFFFDVPSSGFVRMSSINMFSGVAIFMVVEILNQPVLNTGHIGRALHYAFLLFPHYNICFALKGLNNIKSIRNICKAMSEEIPGATVEILCGLNPNCCYDDSTYLQWHEPGIACNLLYFFLVGLVLFSLLILIEYEIGQKLLYRLKQLVKNFSKRTSPQEVIPPAESEDDILDSDVQAEKCLIHSLEHSDIKDHILVLKDLTKYYGNFLAVNQICVGVGRAECFGLLGINGAGKTSTFKMLTGDEMISSGDAWVNGMSLKTDMKRVHQFIGYCPQFDALIEELTGREILIMFCLLRGVPSESAKTLANKLAQELNFNQHIDNKINEYSGGNKRKLSTAIALIGEPSVVYLDEPTTGMDPATKRHLWNAVCRIRDTGTCIVLTSHSMEECEALCTRLAVMVNGEFKCLGSTQHLKNKFSKGYTLTVKLKKEKRKRLTSAAGNYSGLTTGSLGAPLARSEVDEDTHLAGDDPSRNETMIYNTEAINAFILEKFHTAILKESHQCLLTYYIPCTDIPWSRMFGVMESAKVQLGIEDYSLGQTTLEQVFLSFTKRQRSDDKSLP